MTEQTTAEAVDPKLAESAIPDNPVEALEQIIQEHTEEKSEKARNEKGQFVKSDEDIRKDLAKEFPEFRKQTEGDEQNEQPEAGGESPAEGGKKAKAEPGGEAVKPTTRQVGKAIDILKRAQIPQARIDALSDEDKVAWGKELKPVVVGWQQAAQQVAESRKGQETIVGQGAGSKAGEPHDTPLPDLKEAVKDAEREFGPEFAATLEKAITAAVKPLQAKLEAAEAKAGEAGQAQLKAAIDKAREALSGRFPELEDDEVFQADVFPVMVGLNSTGRYSLADMEKLVNQAARIADLDEVESQAKDDKTKLARMRANGTASSKTKGLQGGTMSKEDRETLAAKLALDPRVSVEEARRRVYGS